MSIVATLEEVESQIRAADERIAAELSRLSGVLWRLGGVKQRRALFLDAFRDDLSSLQQRFHEKKLILVVCGATSAGKSTLINAVLRQDLIFTAPEHCTPCSVSIETAVSETAHAFFTEGKWFDGCTELAIAQLHNFCDAKSQSASRLPLFVHLPRDRSQESVLRIANLRLVDSPGLYEIVEESRLDLEGDAFAFVVDFDAGVKWEELERKLRSSSDKAVFFVFNRCDSVELYSSARFEQGRREKLDKAVRFLTDNEVFPDVPAATNSVFFLSARLAVLKRKHETALQQLKAAIVRSLAARQNPQLLVCGGSEVGKTALCNDLIGCELLHLCESPCFVRLQAGEAAEHPLELQELRTDLEARLQSAAEGSVICTSLPDSLLPPMSLLRHRIAVVDSPCEDFPQDFAPAAVALVVSGASSAQKLQRSVERCLERCRASGSVTPFLVVTKMNEVRAKEGEERTRHVEAEIRALWRRLAVSEADAIFFLEKEALMEKYGAAFDAFERQLVAAGHERFADVKLRRIERAAAVVEARLGEALCDTMAQLEAMEAAFCAAPPALSESSEAAAVGATRVDRFLREEALHHGDVTEVTALAARFRDFLRVDLKRQLQLMGAGPMDALGRVDARALEAGRAVLEAGIEALSVEPPGAEVQALQDALPPPRVELESAQERLRVVEAQREAIARRRTDLELRKERNAAHHEHAERENRERAAEIDAIALRIASGKAELGAAQQDAAALRAEVEAARRGCSETEAEAEATRIEADTAATEAAIAEAVIRVMSETIDKMDQPISYVVNPIGTAVNCPKERRRRTKKENERDQHRRTEAEAKANLQQLRTNLQQQRVEKEEKERALNAVEQKIGLTDALMQDAAAKAAAEERRRAAAVAKVQEAIQQMANIEEELETVENEAQEVDRALQAAAKAWKQLQELWETKTEALPGVVREQFDQVSTWEGDKAMRAVREALERFAEAEVAELRRERVELEAAQCGEE